MNNGVTTSATFLHNKEFKHGGNEMDLPILKKKNLQRSRNWS